MADIDQADEWGRRLYPILECYWFSLIRQQKGFQTDPEEFQEMKDTIHALDEVFHELMEQTEMTGWHYGIQPGNNLGFALANLLVQVRNESLIAIAKHMESRRYSALSPELQRVLTFVTGHLDVHRLDTGFLSDGCLVHGAKIQWKGLPRVFTELRQSGLLVTRQKTRGCEFSRPEPYWSEHVLEINV